MNERFGCEGLVKVNEREEEMEGQRCRRSERGLKKKGRSRVGKGNETKKV